MRRRQSVILAKSLIEHLGLSDREAAVFVDETEQPEVLDVFLSDSGRLRRKNRVSTWKGHPVRYIEQGCFKPLRLRVG